MVMAHVAENLLNWGQSPTLGAEMSAHTLNCIREQLESQGRLECLLNTEVLQNAGIFCCFCGKQAPKHFPTLLFRVFPWTFVAEFLLKHSLFQKQTKNAPPQPMYVLR